jgi:hypothetical protein
MGNGISPLIELDEPSKLEERSDTEAPFCPQAAEQLATIHTLLALPTS